MNADKSINQVVAESLNHDYPEAAQRIREGKAMTKAQTAEVHAYCYGICRGFEFNGVQAPPYIAINLMCGRLDRLFTVPEPKETKED